MSQQSVLDVQDLYVTFHQDKKSAELVKGVSFSVAPGSVSAFSANRAQANP